MKSKRIGLILAIVFLAGLSFFTIYSRGFVVRQLPLVHLTMPETATLAWRYEAHSTMRYATEDEIAQGFEWAVDIIIPYEAYRDTMGSLMSLQYGVIGGRIPTAIPAASTYRDRRPNNDVHITVGFNHPRPFAFDGSTATVIAELDHGAPVFDNLLPMSVIREDIFTGDPYIYIVQRRDGAWGNEFFVERLFVQWGLPPTIGNLVNLWPLGGVAIGDNPIVIAEDAPIFHGARVRLFD
jgi:hypothetical protein